MGQYWPIALSLMTVARLGNASFPKPGTIEKSTFR
jgi:hypothetical protein